MPTRRALALEAPVEELISAIALVFDTPAGFDPARSTRRFVLGCPDLAAPIVPGLLSRLGALAPHLETAITPPGPRWPSALASGETDLVLGATLDGKGQALMTRVLGTVRFAVLTRRDHPAVRSGPLDLETWLRWPHVQVHTGDETRNLLQQQLDARGVRRVVGLEVPGFLMALHVIAHTDLFFAAPQELVRELSEPFRLAVHPMPLALPPLSVALFWHARSQQDEGHVWLREQVWAEVAPKLGRTAE